MNDQKYATNQTYTARAEQISILRQSHSVDTGANRPTAQSFKKRRRPKGAVNIEACFTEISGLLHVVALFLIGGEHFTDFGVFTARHHVVEMGS